MSEYSDNWKDERGLIEILVDKGSLPSFDLPVDVVGFESQYSRNFKLLSKHSMRQPLDSAITQWTPKRRIVVEKTVYEIAGLLVPFVPTDEDVDRHNQIQKNRFEHFLNEPGNLKYLLICNSCNHVLTNEDKPIEMLTGKTLEIAEEGGECPTCGSREEFLELEWIKPPGYGPEYMTDTRQPKTEDSIFGGENTYSELSAGRVRWPVQYGGNSELDEIDLKELDPGRNLVMVSSKSPQRLTQIVGRPPEKPEGEDIGEYGYAICEFCGLFDPKPKHNRPYPVYNLKGGKIPWKEFKAEPKCTGKPRSMLVGRPFHSTVLSLKVPLGKTLRDPIESQLSSDDRQAKQALEMAGFTLGRVMIDILAQAKRFQPEEFDCDVRFNRDFTNPDYHALEIFFFEKTDGGSQNLRYFKDLIKSLLSEEPDEWVDENREIGSQILSRLNGDECRILVPKDDGFFEYESHPCEKACNGCLLDYRGSASKTRLHRELAFHLWLYMTGDIDSLRDPSKLNLSTSLIEFYRRCLASQQEYDWQVEFVKEEEKWTKLNFSSDEGQISVEAISDLVAKPKDYDSNYYHAQTLRRNPMPKIEEIEELIEDMG